MVSLVLLVTFLLLSQAVYVVALWAGGRLLKSPKAGPRSAILAILAIDAFSIPLAIISLVLPASSTPSVNLVRALLLLAALLAGTAFILRRVMSLRARAAWAQVGILIAAQLVMLAAAVFAVKPYLTEAFLVPTASMAPTILGWHKETACPKCGRTAFLRVGLNHDGTPMDGGTGATMAVCGTCRSVSRIDSLVLYGLATKGPERVVVNKLATPRRWDVVASRPAHEPMAQIKRLVAFPGETVFIDDGAVWVNGAQLALPAHLKGQTYTTAAVTGERSKFATRSQPLTLLPGECFLLGDFSLLSADSRFSGPEKMSNIIGVADLRYWPLARIAMLR